MACFNCRGGTAFPHKVLKRPELWAAASAVPRGDPLRFRHADPAQLPLVAAQTFVAPILAKSPLVEETTGTSLAKLAGYARCMVRELTARLFKTIPSKTMEPRSKAVIFLQHSLPGGALTQLSPQSNSFTFLQLSSCLAEPGARVNYPGPKSSRLHIQTICRMPYCPWK
jgi:hypothetical protein